MNKNKNQDAASVNPAKAKAGGGVDLSIVPSISDIDTLEPTETLKDFPFADETDTEPEAVLDIPSFLGLDTLDISTASKLAEDLSEDPLRRDSLPEVPSSSAEHAAGTDDLPDIPSFLDETEFEPTEPAVMPDFTLFSEPSAESIPEIPSFAEQTETETEKSETTFEDLPEISSFYNMFGEAKNQNASSAIEIPEKPEHLEEYHDSLTEAAEDILPQVPSVLDLDEMDTLLSMPGSADDSMLLLDEDASYLPEIPSVSDWEEEEEAAAATEEEEEPDENALFLPVMEETLAEEEIIPVTEMPLSVKAKNGLLRSNIRDSKQLVLAREDRLEHISRIDAKTLEEIRSYRQMLSQAVTPEPKAVSKEVRGFLLDFLEELKEIGVPEQKHRALKLYLCAAHQDKSRTREACYADWYQEQHVKLFLDQKITALLRNRQMSGLSMEMLQEDMPVSLSKKILSDMIQEMIDSERIHQARDGYYILKYPTVLEFLEENTQEKEQHIDVIRQRMNGSSLEEIARKTGKSKEHVYKIQNNLLRLVQKLCLINSTSVYEERFRPLFERYNLSKEIFIALTKDSEQTYQYLSMISLAGSAKPEEMKYDFGVPDWIRAAWRELQNQNQN